MYLWLRWRRKGRREGVGANVGREGVSGGWVGAINQIMHFHYLGPRPRSKARGDRKLQRAKRLRWGLALWVGRAEGEGRIGKPGGTTI